MVNAGLMKRPCVDVGMSAPCNPWGGDVDDDLSFTMPGSCLACRDDDPKKLSSAKVTTCLAQVGSRGATLSGWFNTSVMVKIILEKTLKLVGRVWEQNTIPHTKLPSKGMSEILFIKKMNLGRIRFRAENRSEK